MPGRREFLNAEGQTYIVKGMVLVTWHNGTPQQAWEEGTSTEECFCVHGEEKDRRRRRRTDQQGQGHGRCA